MEEIIMGRWHKLKLRCDFCGHFNKNNLTYIVQSPEVSGRFCNDRHAKEAWTEMKEAKNENI